MTLNNKKLLALYGLKWNPFVADVPLEGLYQSEKLQNFAWRVETLIIDGGIASIVGEPGHGKSVTLRLLDFRFHQLKDVVVAQIERPQSGLSDFYRELGDRFGVALKPSNRWGGYKALRDEWRLHIQTTLFRPVLLIDEAQEMPTCVLSELRLLGSDCYDSSRILTTVLAGDRRLLERFRTPELSPLGSRLRCRLHLEAVERDEMSKIIRHAIETAGNQSLMTPDLMQTIVDHSVGNPRIMMNTADELLAYAAQKERPQLDEKLFFEVMGNRTGKPPTKGGKR